MGKGLYNIQEIGTRVLILTSQPGHLESAGSKTKSQVSGYFTVDTVEHPVVLSSHYVPVIKYTNDGDMFRNSTRARLRLPFTNRNDYKLASGSHRNLWVVIISNP